MAVINAVPESKQAYLDELVRRSREGLFPSYDPDTNKCLYRHGDLACGVGLVISDEDYRESFEGDSAHALLLSRPDLIPAWAHDGASKRVIADRFSDIQIVHDQIAKSPSGWDHETFVRDLLSTDLFIGMKPSE